MNFTRKIAFIGFLLFLCLAVPAMSQPQEPLSQERLKRILAYDENYRKFRIQDDDDAMIYAVLPLRPVGQGHALLRIIREQKFPWPSRRTQEETGFEEMTYQYRRMDNGVLKVALKVYKEGSPGDSLNTEIDVPLMGDVEKRGKMPLIYREDNQERESISDHYHVRFTLFPSDRVLVQMLPR